MKQIDYEELVKELTEKNRQLQSELDHWYAMYTYVSEYSYAEAQKLDKKINMLEEKLKCYESTGNVIEILSND